MGIYESRHIGVPTVGNSDARTVYHYTSSTNAWAMLAAFNVAYGDPDEHADAMSDPDVLAFLMQKGITEDVYDGGLRYSRGAGGRDAHHGPGLYVTDIEPGSMTKGQIARRLWSTTRSLRKTEMYLAFEVKNAALMSCRPHVLLVPPQTRPEDVRLLGYGDTPAGIVPPAEPTPLFSDERGSKDILSFDGVPAPGDSIFFEVRHEGERGYDLSRGIVERVRADDVDFWFPDIFESRYVSVKLHHLRRIRGGWRLRRRVRL